MGVVWRTSRAGCAPEILKWLDACANLPGRTVVLEGGRTAARQAQIYSWGRTTLNPNVPPTPSDPGPNGLGGIVTNARDTTESAHGWRADGAFHAVDVFCDGGEPEYRARGELAERMGLTWGGRFRIDGKPDLGHVETKRWRALRPAEPSSGAGGAFPLVAVAAAALVAIGVR